MFLTAAIAVSLTACVVCNDQLSQLPTRMLIVIYFGVAGCSFTWTLALLVLFDLTPIRVAARSPGKLALLLCTFLTIFTVLLNWHWLFAIQAPLSDRFINIFWEVLSESRLPAFAVIAGWLTLRLANATNVMQDWLESAGQLLGVYWILLALLSPILLNTHVLESIGVTMRW
ncbi:hypothetical protein [Novipirellula rosea]|uniref:Uncharacterized protein n=1 Tax=Novipirellula rosea TaxID=1031540 RepID=A0ABP8M6C2_9BACT